jgi:hypothetical protein
MSAGVTSPTGSGGVGSTTQASDDSAVSDADKAKIAGAADGVNDAKIASKLGASADGFSLSVSIPAIVGTGSPVSSEGVVSSMRALGALGQGEAAKFDRSRYAGLVSADPSAPFTGDGATGKLASKDGSMPAGDLAALATYDGARKARTSLVGESDRLVRDKYDPDQKLAGAAELDRRAAIDAQIATNEARLKKTNDVMNGLEPIWSKYKNPLSDDPKGNDDPKAHFDEKTREQQAELLLNQPIATIHKDAYGDALPTRAEVIGAAAARYNLDPAVLSGMILNEQRDQSRREDLADYAGATLGKGDTSIGLGQIMVSTAMKNGSDLLSDTVDPKTRASLTHNDVAKLLTSDDHNIFATARYLRGLADAGAKIGADPKALLVTRSVLPNVDFAAYAGKAWNDDNIRAIGSEYSSKPWDDVLMPIHNWPEYVLDAVDDVRRTGIFSK